VSGRARYAVDSEILTPSEGTSMSFMIAILGAFEDSLNGGPFKLLVHHDTAKHSLITSPLALERILTTPLPLYVSSECIPPEQHHATWDLNDPMIKTETEPVLFESIFFNSKLLIS